MAADRNKTLSRSEEQEFVERVAAHYTPAPLTSAQRLACDRALEARLARRAQVIFFRPFPMLVATVAAVLIWLVMPHLHSHNPTESTSLSSNAVSGLEGAPLEKEENLLIYAYYSSDFDEDETEGEAENFLPDEYEAFDSAFMFPGA